MNMQEQVSMSPGLQRAAAARERMTEMLRSPEKAESASDESQSLGAQLAAKVYAEQAPQAAIPGVPAAGESVLQQGAALPEPEVEPEGAAEAAASPKKEAAPAESEKSDEDSLEPPEPDEPEVATADAGNKDIIDALRGLLSERNSARQQQDDNDGDAAVDALLSDDELASVVKQLAETPRVAEGLRLEVARLMKEQMAEQRRQDSVRYLDETHPELAPYLKSRQWKQFRASDLGGGQYNAGLTMGDVLDRAMATGDRKTMSAVAKQFIGSLRGARPQRIDPPRSGVATGVKVAKPEAAAPAAAPVDFKESLRTALRQGKRGDQLKDVLGALKNLH